MYIVWVWTQCNNLQVPMFLNLLRYPGHIVGNNRKLINQRCGYRDLSNEVCHDLPFSMNIFQNWPPPTESAILRCSTERKMTFSILFWTKYWGCSWFWISIKLLYGCYTSRTQYKVLKHSSKHVLGVRVCMNFTVLSQGAWII